jgi:hypothetical protein
MFVQYIVLPVFLNIIPTLVPYCINEILVSNRNERMKLNLLVLKPKDSEVGKESSTPTKARRKIAKGSVTTVSNIPGDTNAVQPMEPGRKSQEELGKKWIQEKVATALDHQSH